MFAARRGQANAVQKGGLVEAERLPFRGLVRGETREDADRRSCAAPGIRTILVVQLAQDLRALPRSPPDVSAEPPKRPECRSLLGPVNVSSQLHMPRSLVVRPGVSTSHMLVSLISAKSAPNASLLAFRNGSRLGLPTSSSPSISTMTGAGMPPPTLFQARRASTNQHHRDWPFSSTAPRATIRGLRGPSSSWGSNGGLFHSSARSAGCPS